MKNRDDLPPPQNPHYARQVEESFYSQAFMHFIGAELVKVSPGFCEIRLPYKKELTQQDGYFHAGVIGTLADNAGGYAAYTLMPAGSRVLTVEYKLNLLSPGRGEELRARSYVIKAGRTLTVCHSEVFAAGNGCEKLCATSQMTLICLPGQNNA